MILTQILEPSCVRAPLMGQSKEEVIIELVDSLAQRDLLLDRDVVLEAVLMREETRSTGIGSGIAIPHGKCTGVKELVMSIGIAPNGVDFNSIDNNPATIIVLLASPSDSTGPHIQALARISRMMLDDDFKTKLETATTPEEVYNLISSKENE